jgi:hypothetical protein
MRFQERTCGPGGVSVDAVSSGNSEGGELVSPVGFIVSKVSGLDLTTPDARHRRPLKFFSEDRGAKFLKITSARFGKIQRRLSGTKQATNCEGEEPGIKRGLNPARCL